MGAWKRFGWRWWEQYLQSQKPEFRGLRLAGYVYGQNWRSGDPFGVGKVARRFRSAYFFHDHGFSSPFGWDKATGRVYVVQDPSSQMYFKDEVVDAATGSRVKFGVARAQLSDLLVREYGAFEASDVDLHVRYQKTGEQSEYRLWYSARSPVHDLSHYLDDHLLPEGLHTRGSRTSILS